MSERFLLFRVDSSFVFSIALFPGYTKNSMQRTKYQSITIKRKLESIDLVDKEPPGKKNIASEVGIPASSLSTILKNRDVLQASHAFGSSKKKCNRDSSRPDVDVALFQWFTAARALSIPISGKDLKTKAEELRS